jgi:hypothetical protein
MKKIIKIILEVESDDEHMMSDKFIKTDLEQEINCASNSYTVVSINTIPDAT